MSEYYPVLKIPQKILDINVHIPEIKVPEAKVPLHTKKPAKPLISKLIKPRKLKFILIGLGLFFLSVFISLPSGAIILILGGTTTVFIYFKNQSNYAMKKAEYNSVLQQYEQALQQWQNQELAITNSHSQKLTNQIDLLEKNQVIEHYKRRFNHLKVLSPTPGSNAPKGRAEFDFYERLNHYFPGQILRDYKIVKYVKYPYTPDLIFHRPDWNLYIDIEIDEPYTCSGRKRKTTHCIDIPKERERDDFFLHKNWIVIRFAEEQVIKFPKSCCKFIASVINKLTGQTIPEDLKNTPRLKDVARWDTKKAKQMARGKYRNY